MSRASKTGIIIKNSGTLEQLARAKSAEFDKTGTLTAGTPEVLTVHTAPGTDEATVLALAAAVEAGSNHPLAQAVADAARQRHLPFQQVEGVEEVIAHGVQADVAGQLVKVGKLSCVTAQPTPAQAVHAEPGHSLIHVSVDNRWIGALEIGDRVRPEACATLEELHRLGLQDTIMLSGDAAATARAIAGQVGLDTVYAELLPQDKVTRMRELTLRPVIAVGDGANDAPVLAVAEIGIAMGARGSVAASQSADVVILHDDLYKVARAVHIGQRTMGVAWQAILIGVVFSLVLMLIASTGVMPAIVGGLFAGVCRFDLHPLGAAGSKARPV